MPKIKYITNSQANKALSKSVSEHFEIGELGNKQSLKWIDHKYGLVDLKGMSLARAENLVKSGCPYLKPKGKSKKDSDK